MDFGLEGGVTVEMVSRLMDLKDLRLWEDLQVEQIRVETG
jgi:hypothetical protein